MAAMPYLFRRPGSPNWYYKFQNVGGKAIVKSLRITDKAEAERAIIPLIADHMQRLAERRPRWVQERVYFLEPGRLHDRNSLPPHVADALHIIDGQRVSATEHELIYYGPDGQEIKEKRAPNGGMGARPVGVIKGLEMTMPANTRLHPIIFREGQSDVRRSAPKADPDDAILDDYLAHGSTKRKAPISDKYKIAEARDTLATFKRLTGATLKGMTFDDAQKLADHYVAQGLKGATVQKKMKWLSCAVNRAIITSKLPKGTVNLFSHAMPNDDDSDDRLRFSDDDMAIIKANLGKLDNKRDKLLVRIMATMGLRPSEAFQIEGERIEKGVRYCHICMRYCHIGTKSEHSNRRVPFSDDVLQSGLLPDKIEGRLLAGRYKGDADGKLAAFIREDCGITDPLKVVYSFRHTFIGRLRDSGITKDLLKEIAGHSPDVTDTYGSDGKAKKLSPMPILKGWVDKVGF
jgi:integrase